MIEYRELRTVEELRKCEQLEIVTWQLDPLDTVPMYIMRSISLHGGLINGAFDGERLVGMAVAFPARHGRQWVLWSQMAGVHPDYQRQGIGFGVKQAQRQWALAHGFREIRWTFDPLQRGNANFNLRLLGVRADTYHVDYYGIMDDAINRGMPSDRLEVSWKLADSRVKALAVGERVSPFAETIVDEKCALKASDEDSPLVVDPIDWSSPLLFLQIPYVLSKLRQMNPAVVVSWRLAMRQVLQEAFSRGYAVVDFADDGNNCAYVLRAATAYYLYVVLCDDQSLYTGIAADLRERIRQHNAGRGAAYTRSRRPVQLLAAWRFPDRGSALRVEAVFKRLSRQEKLDHVRLKKSCGESPYLEAEMFL